MGNAYDELAGRRVVITGANRGIGRALAEGFVGVDADVTIVALEDDVFDVASGLCESAIGIASDIGDAEAIAQMAESIDRVDVLVNNAGFEYRTPIADLAPSVSRNFRRIIETNVIGTFEITRALLSKIPDGGRIINTASTWGKTGVPEYSGYCASKHAIIGLTRSLAKELGPRRISVNAVCPGWVRTDTAMRSLKQIAESEMLTESRLLEEIIAAQALDGLMEPHDMVDMYLFLASDAARNITGQAYTVDRGEIMR